MHPQHDRLNLLLQRYTDKTLTAPEQAELSALLLQDWHELKNDQHAAPVDWKQMVQQILSSTESQATPVHRIHFLRTAWFRYAAAILIMIGIGTVAYRWNAKEKETRSVAQTPTPIENDVAPGGNRAVLTLAGGRQIVLDSAANGLLAEEGQTRVMKNATGEIIYEAKTSLSPSIHLNTLSTPRGGQYQVSLPDGSRVWLNAESSITYPVVFAGNTREVSITGEAYFEVAKNKTKPFIVQTPGESIRVLGTHFNVNAYKDEAGIKTSLIEGSVRVGEKILKPGQAFQNGKISATNVTQDIAWKEGLFSFKKADLQSVMRQLARWYDLNIQYSGTIPQRNFTGEIDRNLTLKQVLNVLTHTRVKYELKGNTLIIEP